MAYVMTLLTLIVLLLLMALCMKRRHYVKREVIIGAPRQKVFDYIKLLKNQDEFNQRAADGERQKEYTGTDGTVGFIYVWKGDKKAGEGEKEIISLTEGESMEAEIRFVKPMVVKARIIMQLEDAADGQTKCSWINTGLLPYPMNLLIPIMQNSVAKDMDESLQRLKNIVEQ